MRVKKSLVQNSKPGRVPLTRSSLMMGLTLALVAGAAPFVARAFPAFAPAFVVQREPPVPPEDVIPSGTGKIVPIVISPSGFDAEGFTLQAGVHRFILSNNTGITDQELVGVVVDAASERVLVRQAVNRRSNAVIEATLPPGQYIVVEAAHPSWRLPLNVIP